MESARMIAPAQRLLEASPDPFGQSFTYTYYINNPCVLLKSLPLVAAAFSHHSRFPNLTHVAALQRKTVNPLDPRQRFCQYWLRECNLTADNRFCCGLGTLKSANHRAGTPINQSHCGSAGSLNFCESEANPTSPTVKIASPCGTKGLTVFGPNHDTSDSSLYLCYPK